MLAKKTYKNQITIPQMVIKDFPGVEYFVVERRGNEIVLKPVTLPDSQNLDQIRKKMDQLGITPKDIEDAVEWARKIAVACRCSQELREFMYDPAS